MKVGTLIEAEVTLYRIKIEGRGGDNEQDCYYETREAAIIASAIDGLNLEPIPEQVFKTSDGHYIKRPQRVYLSKAPTEEELATLKVKLSPVVKLLLERKKSS